MAGIPSRRMVQQPTDALTAALNDLRSLNEQLRRQNALFDKALNNMSQGLCFFDGARRLIVCNERYRAIYRLPPELVRPGTSLRKIVDHRLAIGACPEMTAEEYLVWRDNVALSQTTSETTIRLKDGRVIAILHEPMPDGGWVATHEDITARVRVEDELAEQNRRFNAALSNMAQGLCLFDSESRLLVCNERYAELYKLPPELTVPGTSIRQILDHRMTVKTGPLNRQTYEACELSPASLDQSNEYRLQLQDGRTLQVSHEPMIRGGWVATIQDITDAIRAEAQIVHMARHDALTDLGNRILLRAKMEEELARARRGEQFALLCLDLDHFKRVNDTLGHAIGDGVLTAVAVRVADCIRDVDTAARLGGDEFAIVQSQLQSRDSAAILAQRLIALLSEPYRIEGHPVTIGVSIGIAMAPRDGNDAEDLLKKADLALYRAKADRRQGFCFFEPQATPPLACRGQL